MSTFYGMIRGNRGEATRGGSRNSGFKASAQSYNGSVITYLSYDKDDNLKIEIGIANGSSSNSEWGNPRFYGTLDELKECFEHYEKLKEE